MITIEMNLKSFLASTRDLNASMSQKVREDRISLNSWPARSCGASTFASIQHILQTAARAIFENSQTLLWCSFSGFPRIFQSRAGEEES